MRRTNIPDRSDKRGGKNIKTKEEEKKKTDEERKNKNVLIGLILHIPTVSKKKKKIFLWLPEAHQREDPSSQQWTSHRGDDYHEMWRDA